MITATWLLLLLAQDGQPTKVTAPQRTQGPFVSWWENTQRLDELQIPIEARPELIAQLKRLQLTIWDRQSKLKQALLILRDDFKNADIASEKLLNRWKKEVIPLRMEIEETKARARLLVRDMLNPDGLAHISTTYPRFFDVNWFPRSRMPVVFKGDPLDADEE